MISLGQLASLGALFGLAFAGSFGFPGGLITMVSLGAIAGNLGELIWIIIVAVTASIAGDLAAYEFARRFSYFLKNKIIKYKFFREGEKDARELVTKYGFTLVFFTRFALVALCAVVTYICGFERGDRRKFAIAVIFGETIYGVLYPVLGYIFKETWNDLVGVVQNALIAAVLIGFAVYLIWRKFRKH